jgi:putative serine/threonine protein kinase
MIFLTKGKRGKIYLDKDKAIKKTNNQRVEKEAYYLKLLNKYKIGPKFLYLKKDRIVYKFVKGPFILEYLKNNNTKSVKKILKEVLNQCRTLDKLKINKLELHNPYKHIIIEGTKTKKPVMIDFERAYKTENPKNVTQFCQYIMSFKVYSVLKEKKIIFNKKELIKSLRIYKKEQTDFNFRNLIKGIFK